MKRRVAFLALPLLLAALLFGVKWRADHPTPTKEDLEIRAFLSKFRTVKIGYIFGNPNLNTSQNIYQSNLSKEESQLLVQCFYLSPVQSPINRSISIPSGSITITFLSQAGKANSLYSHASISVDGRRGVFLDGRGLADAEQNLHPATVKRWLDLLLSNPRIGPELRARMNR